MRFLQYVVVQAIGGSAAPAVARCAFPTTFVLLPQSRAGREAQFIVKFNASALTQLVNRLAFWDVVLA